MFQPAHPNQVKSKSFQSVHLIILIPISTSASESTSNQLSELSLFHLSKWFVINIGNPFRLQHIECCFKRAASQSAPQCLSWLLNRRFRFNVDKCVSNASASESASLKQASLIRYLIQFQPAHQNLKLKWNVSFSPSVWVEVSKESLACLRKSVRWSHRFQLKCLCFSPTQPLS